MNNKIQSDKDNFLDNLIYEIAIMGVLGSIFRQDNFLTIYERFWHLGGHVCTQAPPPGLDRRGAWVHICVPRRRRLGTHYVPRRRRLGTHFGSFCTECYPSEV